MLYKPNLLTPMKVIASVSVVRGRVTRVLKKNSLMPGGGEGHCCTLRGRAKVCLVAHADGVNDPVSAIQKEVGVFKSKINIVKGALADADGDHHS